MKKLKFKKIKKTDVKKKVTSLKQRAKKTLRKNIILSGLMLIGIGILTIIIGFMTYIMITAPDFNTDLLYEKEATIIYDNKGNEIARIGAENRELVTYDELPQVLIDAIVATEDSRFFQHDGFDIARFMKAGVGQVLGSSNAGGASTLTMQIVKNTFTSTEQTITRKFTDIYMAIFKVEKKYTKEEIIEFYVNQPWLGQGSYGVEQACQTYFGKSVRDLTLTEAALIAGMFQAPYSYNPFVYPENATARRNTVLNLMVKHGYITEEQAKIAKEIKVESLLTTNNKNQSIYQDFIDTLVEDVIAKTDNDPYNIPMEIYTTLDTSVQDVINQLQKGDLYTYANDVVQIGVAITNVKDGSVVAVGAGRNRKGERQYNRATMLNNHPGSTAKPIFDYGPFIEYNNGSTYSPFLDEPMKYSNGSSLKNSDGSYLGLMTMRQALVKSRNIPAVTAFQQIDPEKIAEFAHGLNINYGDDLFESCAIGGFNGVSPLTLSAAYAAFARGGYYVEPYTYTKIHYLENDETVQYKYQPIQVMSDSTAYMINSMLVTGGQNGVGGNIHVSGTDVAAKSGTSTIDATFRKNHNIPDSASMDNWVNVYSPDLSISLWYGYDVLSGEYYTTSMGGAAARKKLMTALANKVIPKNSRFSKPSSVVSAEIELETFPAQLASANTPADLKSTEYFKKGTEPTDTSKRFDTLDNPTNGKATITGNTVNITWDAIKTPEAIDTEVLKNIFTENYRDYADKYYDKRINYNNSYIGSIGYQVYLQDASGNLQSLGYTNNTSFGYTMVNPNSNYKFVIKSAYSIFKTNMSNGLTISITNSEGDNNPAPVAPSIERPATPTNCPSLTITANQKNTYVAANSTSNNYIDITNPFKVLNNDNDITSSVTSTPKYYEWVNNKYSPVTNILTNTPGKYQITYNITYNNCNYSVSRYVWICMNGVNANNNGCL